MKILYVGEYAFGATSRHRADALRRLGHDVEVLDPAEAVRRLSGTSLLRKFHDTTGQTLLAAPTCRWLRRRLLSAGGFDLVWVNSGEFLTPEAVRMLARIGRRVVLYSNDDPTGPRDGNRFLQVRRSLKLYHVCVVPRESTAEEMLRMGAERVLRVYFSYDEVGHAPPKSDECIAPEYLTDASFVGTWMRGEGRDEFLNKLWRAGLHVSIWGPRWEKSQFKELVKTCWKGVWIAGRQYVYALAGAKACLGMLSKGNRDLHTQRSLEIPYAGGLLCAERTSEHMEMFKDGEEAVFWSSPEECVRLCRELLSDEERRKQIVANGMRKVRQLKVGNEDVCRRILEEVIGEQR